MKKGKAPHYDELSIWSSSSEESSDLGQDNTVEEDLGTFRKESERLYVWKSNFEYVVYILCMTTDPAVQYFILSHIGSLGSNDLCFIIIQLILLMPLLYMQVYLGQFSQLGCLFLGYLAPILQGLGISMMIISFAVLLIKGDYISFSLHYFFNSLKKPWLHCDVPYTCVSAADITNCSFHICEQQDFNRFSAKLYLRSLFEESWGAIQRLEFVLTFLGVGAMTYFILMKGFLFYKNLIKKCFVLARIFDILMILSFVVLSDEARSSFKNVIHFKFTVPFHESLFSPVAILAANVGLATGGPMLYGSYVPSCVNIEMQSIVIAMVFIGTRFLGATLSRIMTYSLAIRANLPPDFEIRDGGEILTMMFAIHAQALGLLPASSFFSAVYYFNCSISAFIYQVLYIDVIFQTVTNRFHSWTVHKKYIIAFIITFNIMLQLLPFFKSLGVYFRETYVCIFINAGLYVLLIQTVYCTYLYGFQRFSDDVHFTTGRQPVFFWKAAWLISPILLVVSLYYSPKLYTAELPFYLPPLLIAFVLLPAVVMAVWKTYQYTVYHNIFGVLFPHDNWGPNDPTERKLRKIYNPRKETHYERREYKCNHQCLLGSDVLVKVIENERADLRTLRQIQEKANERQMKEKAGEFDSEDQIEGKGKERKGMTQISVSDSQILPRSSKTGEEENN